MVLWHRVVKSQILSSPLVLHRIARFDVSIPPFLIWRAEATAWPLLDWYGVIILATPWQLSLRIVSSLGWSLIKLVWTWLFRVIDLIVATSSVVVSIQALVVAVEVMSLWTIIPTLLSL